MRSLLFDPDTTDARRSHLREQDWNMKYRKEGTGPAYFTTEKSQSPHDPPNGLVRSLASPSGAANALPSPSLYSTSLRSTHVAGEPEPEPEQSFSLPDPLPPQAELGTFPDTLNFNPTLNSSDTAAFDGFGFGNGAEAQAGGPALFPPDAIFDWEQWSSFFSGVPGGGTTPNGL